MRFRAYRAGEERGGVRIWLADKCFQGLSLLWGAAIFSGKSIQVEEFGISELNSIFESYGGSAGSESTLPEVSSGVAAITEPGIRKDKLVFVGL